MQKHQQFTAEVMILLSVKPDFPDHDGVGASVVRDGLSIVAGDHAGHSLREPGQDPHSLHGIPARTELGKAPNQEFG